jgi:ribonuclease T2
VIRWVALLFVAIGLPAPAFAQAYNCHLPERIELPPPARPDGPRVRSAIGGYVLAVSWSPEYCRGKRGADPANMQCNGRNGRFGFVLHGLWPEAVKGPPPQWCALGPRPREEDLRANLCRTPVPWLIEHEWAKHGSCMARSPAGYLKVSGILWDSLRLPDADGLSRRQGLTAGDLRRAFVLNNPGWKKEAVGVLVSNGGWLRELHLCYGSNFLPRACPRRNFGPKDSAPLKIWRGL